MGYHANTIAAGVVAAVLTIPSCWGLWHAARTLHEYRSKGSSSSSSSAAASGAGARAKYPLLLRVLFLLTNICACIMGLNAFMTAWMYADEGVRIDPFHQTSVQMFSLQTRFCTVGIKTGPSVYVTSKLFSYMFFFIKQRTVRPMSQPTWQEKIIFLMTLGICSFACFVALIAEGEVNPLDHTCQMYIPIWAFGIMAGADSSISLGYLFLFIQPLRETIRSNQQARSNADAQARSTAKVASSDNKATSVPSANSALEEVMRKNTYSCVLAVVVSFCSMAFMTISHAVEDDYSRKWIMPCGTADGLITALTLAHIMRKPVKPAAAQVREAVPLSNTSKSTNPPDKSSTQGHGNRLHPLGPAEVQLTRSPAGPTHATADASDSSEDRHQQASPTNQVRPIMVSPMCYHSSSSPLEYPGSTSPVASSPHPIAASPFHEPLQQDAADSGGSTAVTIHCGGTDAQVTMAAVSASETSDEA